MSIKIIKPGIMTSLQDSGRSGYRSIGVGSGGAMDVFAMSVANYLAGNDEQNAVVEIHFPAPEIIFEQDAIIAIGGADFNALVDEVPVKLWQTLFIKKDSILKFKQPLFGARVYIAVQGGWQADKWLNSFSTHLKLSVGGHCGRVLQKDDRLFFATGAQAVVENKRLATLISQKQIDEIYRPVDEIRCTPSVEHELLNSDSMKSFAEQNFVVSSESDRMGYRLNGAPLMLRQATELISSPVDAGTIQLLPDGNCIVLMADHQTTGGYPRIASVIKADLPRLAQRKPGGSIHFTMISLQQAEQLYLQMKKILKEIKISCHLHRSK